MAPLAARSQLEDSFQNHQLSLQYLHQPESAPVCLSPLHSPRAGFAGPATKPSLPPSLPPPPSPPPYYNNNSSSCRWKLRSPPHDQDDDREEFAAAKARTHQLVPASPPPAVHYHDPQHLASSFAAGQALQHGPGFAPQSGHGYSSGGSGGSWASPLSPPASSEGITSPVAVPGSSLPGPAPGHCPSPPPLFIEDILKDPHSHLPLAGPGAGSYLDQHGFSRGGGGGLLLGRTDYSVPAPQYHPWPPLSLPQSYSHSHSHSHSHSQSQSLSLAIPPPQSHLQPQSSAPAPPIPPQPPVPDPGPRRKKRRLTQPSEANFRCAQCGRHFSRVWNYTAHLDTHNPHRARPHVCVARGCGKAFVRRTDLARHTQCVHARDKRFSCPLCHSRFARKDTLRRHEDDGCPQRLDIAPRQTRAGRPVHSEALLAFSQLYLPQYEAGGLPPLADVLPSTRPS